MFEQVVEEFLDCGTDDQQEDQRITGSMTRTFNVYFESNVTITDKQVYVLTASAGGTSIPAQDSVHPVSSDWVCRRRSARPFDRSALHWKVTCYYEYSVNPLLLPTEVEYSFVEHPEPTEMDYSGLPITMSSGESLDPLMEKPYNDLMIRVVRNEATFDPFFASGYVDRVNSNAMLINSVLFPAYTIKCENISATKFTWGGTYYYQVTYEFAVRTAVKPGTSEVFGWRRRVLDQGFYTLSGLTPEAGQSPMRRILDIDGNEKMQPTLLDGSGQILDAGATPYWHYFEIYDVADFSVFTFSW